MARTTIPAELVAINAIQGTLIADNAITAVHIATNAVSGTLVADNAITSTHIAQNNVTATQIAQNTITVTQMADSAIETAKINNDAVTQAKIADDAVGADQLAANSVTSASIVNGTIVTADLGDNAVTLAKMASLARGSIIYGDSAGDPAALSIGSNGTVLKSDGTDISWGAEAGGVAGINSSADADAIFINSSENVGIGSSTINAKFNVHGTIRAENDRFLSGREDAAAPAYAFHDDADTGIFNVNPNILGFSTAGSERMRINGSGNVGIGTSSPSQKLHVNGEIKATSADITDGSGNTSIGYGALNNLTSGDSNVALGYEALEDVNSGIHNVGLGYRAGMNITTGQYNVAVGNYALSTNTTGGWNTCIGYGAGNTMSGNDHNTCIGRNAGYNITSGGSNTIIGSQAGDAQTSAHNNTFVGTRAGTSATTGNGYNTAIGVDALEDCTTGSFNVSLGTNTIKNVTTGANNIGVGYRAGNAGQPGGQITSQSNIACIGDTAITSLNCQVSLSVASDQRDKTDFTPLDLGLNFVKSLTPYTFKWDKRSNYVDWDSNPTTDLDTVTHDGTHKEDQLDIGFKAQDVEVLEEAAGYNKDNKTNLTYALSPDGKIYSMKYEKLVPVLVKAIQELEADLKEAHVKIDAQELRIAKLEE